MVQVSNNESSFLQQPTIMLELVETNFTYMYPVFDRRFLKFSSADT